MSVTPDSAFPVLIPSRLPGRPKSVTLAHFEEHNGSAYAAPGPVQWEYVVLGGVPHVKVLNVPNLPAGTWDLTFRIEWGG